MLREGLIWFYSVYFRMEKIYSLISGEAETFETQYLLLQNGKRFVVASVPKHCL